MSKVGYLFWILCSVIAQHLILLDQERGHGITLDA